MEKKKSNRVTFGEFMAVVTAICLLWAKSIFWVIQKLPAYRATRPIIRWAFCVERAIEVMADNMIRPYGYNELHEHLDWKLDLKQK